MKLLAIDTTSKVAGAALLEDGRVVCETNLVSALKHSELLMPIVDNCMRLARWQPQDLDAVGAVVGPGSFTGIRIGVAAAKGIAEGIGKPVIAVNALESLAASFRGFGGVVLPMLDARNRQVFYALYGTDGSELLQPDATTLDELLAKPEVRNAQAVLFTGDGAEATREAVTQALGVRAVFAPQHLMAQRAGAAAMVAWEKALAGQTMDAAALEPLYLRKSSAEQVREKREAAHGG